MHNASEISPSRHRRSHHQSPHTHSYRNPPKTQPTIRTRLRANSSAGYLSFIFVLPLVPIAFESSELRALVKLVPVGSFCLPYKHKRNIPRRHIELAL